MSDLRQAAQQVLDAWQTSLYGKPSHQKAVVLAMTNLNIVLQQQAEPVHGDIRALKYRIHELEGEVMGYKRMLDVAEAASQPQQQAEPVAWTLTKTLNKRETTTRAYLWFSNPQNYLWTPLYTTPPQRKPLTDEQADQIISGLQTCHHQSSKREFLKVWLRDWAAHHIQEPKS